ncbi:MAG: 3-hydroxyacyl-CoA dehydrogenase family protein, partial [Rhodoglobus sp.]|nr:3-hydroxyacyl-CoA dehydrogenase family protein [Rhodoglobus sp.]
MTKVAPSPISVAVVGGGIMGRGIAASLAAAGHSVSVVESDAAAASSLLDRIAGQLESEPAVDAAASLERISVGTVLDAVIAAGLVIEAVPEDMAIKTPLWQRLGELCDPAALLASNTSAFDIDSLAELVPGPERVLGTHWFNPAIVVPCVEVVRGSATSDAVIDRTIALLAAAGKSPIVVANSPGFVANRIQFALVREALLCLEEGLASAEDIDTIVSTS